MYETINLSSYFRKPENKTTLEKITSKTFFLNHLNPPIRQRLWHYESNQSEIPKCSCGKELRWSEKMRSYRTYCSQKCKGNSVEWKNKVSESNIKKYGVKTTLLEKNTKNKITASLQERYGVDNPFKNKNIQEKIKKTHLKNYGVTNPSKSKIIKDKITESHLRKYGYERASQSHIPDDVFNLINSKEELEKKYLSSFSGNTLAEELGISPWLLFKQIHKLGIDIKPLKKSKEENIIVDLLLDFGVSNIIIGDKSTIFPQEIDILIPDYKIGFEINGIYWHSESKGKGKYYHINKSKKAYEKNIKLIHFTDLDINLNFEKVKNKIKSVLGMNKKIYARKCEVKAVGKSEEIFFLNNNHFQNYVPSKICLGLYYEDELLSLMSFGRSRYNKNYDWELLRFCSKGGINVIGGASKLFNHFAKSYSPKNCISYCDLSRSIDSNFYSNLGFTYSKSSTPNYFYTKNYSSLESRIKYQKHKLPKILKKYEEDLTEWQNMSNNGWDRYWDCGNSIWTWSNQI